MRKRSRSCEQRSANVSHRVSSTDRTTSCIWCGHEETYRPNVPKSVTACKRRIKAHELTCKQSPVVVRLNQLKQINSDLTKALSRKKGYTRVLEQYLNPRRKPESPVPILTDLGTLARGSVLEDDVLVSVNREDPHSCVICDSAGSDIMPMRVKDKSCTHVVLLCRHCQPRGAKKTPREVAQLINVCSERNKHECAFLWEMNDRIRMLWGEQLQVETIR